MVHIPPFEDSATGGMIWPLFSSTEADRRLHLLLSGHDHKYLRVDPGSTVLAPASTRIKKDFKASVQPFMRIAIATDTIAEVKITADNLKVRIVKTNGDDLDAFAISKDGKIQNAQGSVPQ